MGIFGTKKYHILEWYSANVAKWLAAGIPILPPPPLPDMSNFSQRDQRAYEAEYKEVKPAMDALYRKAMK